MNATDIALDQMNGVDVTDLRRGDIIVDDTYIPYDGIGAVMWIDRAPAAWTIACRCLDGDHVTDAQVKLAPRIFVGVLKTRLRIPESEQNIRAAVDDARNDA